MPEINKGLILFGLSSIILFSCTDTAKSPPGNGGNRSLQADVVVVQPENLNEKYYSTGTLVPAEEVMLKSEISGRITELFFVEGQSIAKGSRIFSIDDSEYQAELKKLLVQLDLAKSELKRNEDLFRENALSQELYDASVNRVAELESDIALIRVRIDRCHIRAPFNAKAGLRLVSPGAYVTAGQELIRLVQTDPIKIAFEVPEKLASQIKTGLQVFAVVGETNDTFKAHVYATDAAIDPGSRNLKVQAKTDNPGQALIPGTFVKVILNMEEIPDAVMLPSEAIVPELNAEKVFTLKNGQVQETQVKTGLRTESRIQITQGLSAGDTVLVTGILQARAGMPVQVKHVMGRP